MSKSVDAGAFDEPLEAELDTVVGERVNALPSVVAERYAALRWSLVRENAHVCDGYATEETPGVAAETPVEVKSCKVTHGGGREGRIDTHVSSHEQLLERDGVYAIVVYAPVTVAGAERIVVLAAGIVDAAEVDRWIDDSGRWAYQKVRYSQLLDEDVDRDRWSA